MQTENRTFERAAGRELLAFGEFQAYALLQSLHVPYLTAVSPPGERAEDWLQLLACQHIFVILQTDGEAHLILKGIGIRSEKHLIGVEYLQQGFVSIHILII